MEIDEHTISQVGSSEVSSARCEHAKILKISGWIGPFHHISQLRRILVGGASSSAKPRPSVAAPPSHAHRPLSATNAAIIAVITTVKATAIVAMVAIESTITLNVASFITRPSVSQGHRLRCRNHLDDRIHCHHYQGLLHRRRSRLSAAASVVLALFSFPCLVDVCES